MTKSTRMSRTTLITGGTSGLGAAICAHLSRDGYRVIANYLPSTKQSAEQWQAELANDGISVDLIAADVSDLSQCEAMAKQLSDTYGTIEVLVNNAGITRDSTIKKMPADEWHAVINTNLTSLYNVCRPLLDGMQDNHFGRIVNISSVSAQRGQFGQTNYCAAKAGVHGFTKALALETARHGITVNSVSPGMIDTAMVQAIPSHMHQGIIDSIPVGRIGDPADIARAVRFLVDDDAGYITGSEISVNGGLFMH
jgi:acetoacetyl-CoA reductase